MNGKLQEKLFKRHPSLFTQGKWQKTIDIGVDDVWYDVIDLLFGKLVALNTELDSSAVILERLCDVDCELLVDWMFVDKKDNNVFGEVSDNDKTFIPKIRKVIVSAQNKTKKISKRIEV
jgi:hypothetical protein